MSKEVLYIIAALGVFGIYLSLVTKIVHTLSG